MADRKHPLVQSVQTSIANTKVNRVVTEPHRAQLSARHNPVLPLRNLRHPRVSPPSPF